MAYSKLARARYNCYEDRDYGGNAYSGSHHRDGHFTHKSQMGIGALCTVFRTSDLCLIDCWHDVLDIISLVVDLFPSWTPMCGMIPSYFFDPFVGNFLVKKVQGYLCSLTEDLLDRGLVTLQWHLCVYLVDNSSLNFFIYATFAFHRPFQEELQSLFSLCSRRSFAFTCQVLLEIVHSIPPLVNIISIVAHLLWLFKGTNLRTNPFKRGLDGMTRDRHKNMESFQGSGMRLRARKMEEKMQRIKLGRV
ncbi:hypothetical protein M9H77_17593 [Catharanthus roseus]|uniref:Uncharacterized protein n=1 Tax=Catharanthus roseus TaxID=4058 RepID=A0ACC0B526_CATRO|nr:hypothetical protein M9H77_17593 [Catharanthus roseus]